jgi:phosphotransferase system enzyme I (PtsP)
MTDPVETDSRRLLQRLRAALAEGGGGQGRLDRITGLIAESMGPMCARSI